MSSYNGLFEFLDRLKADGLRNLLVTDSDRYGCWGLQKPDEMNVGSPISEGWETLTWRLCALIKITRCFAER